MPHIVLISFREWLHSYIRMAFIITFSNKDKVLISFREWLHSYFIEPPSGALMDYQLFSSLSESGFIPTTWSQAVEDSLEEKFSSLSESGFIPTMASSIAWG